MAPEQSPQPVFRFAPSPNGYLHLGHAYSAILNFNMARQAGGRFLIRIEDIDRTRFRPAFLNAIFEDLAWLGLSWDEPASHQSDQFDRYRGVLITLADRLPLYASDQSRNQIRRFVSDWEREHDAVWPRDPDGAVHFPSALRPVNRLTPEGIEAAFGVPIRIAMDEAVRTAPAELTWRETGCGPAGETGTIAVDPGVWGDVILARREFPTSYPLSVVVDDAAEGVTDIVRGQDLFHATSVQRLLQHALDLPVPGYHHHPLILDGSGRKLSKSEGAESLVALRASGARPEDVFDRIGLQPVS